MISFKLHRAHEVVYDALRIFTDDKEQAHLRADLIVRRLFSAGVLQDAELFQDTVIEAGSLRQSHAAAD